MRRASTDLWGLLSLGHFRTDRHETLASDWLLSVVNEYGGYLKTFSDHVGDLLGWTHDEAESYRLRIVRMQDGETDKSLAYIILTAARALSLHAGLPEPEPKMEGDADATKLARALYVVERYFEGFGRNASTAAGYNEAYMAVQKHRAKGPSDAFLHALASAAKCSSDWLRYGKGAP